MNQCQLCGRITKSGTTEHHLIPRTCHSNKWFKKRFTRSRMSETIDICRDCHHEIHELFPSEKQLGREFNTIDKLTQEPRFERFLGWVRKQK